MPPAEPLLPPPPASDPSQPSLPPPPPSVQLTPLLGNAQSEHLQALHSLYASQIATLIWVSEAEGALALERRAVIVGIALRRSGDEMEGAALSKEEKDVFFGVMDVVRALLTRT